jgi:hypothetical protein
MPNRKKALATYFLIGLFMGFSVFLVTAEIYGVPLWWIFSGLHRQSIAQLPSISALITPQNPATLDQQENILVQDASTGAPLPGANITVFYDGAIVLTESANSTGQAIFRYAGSPTIINFQANGYTSAMYVVPNAPVQWVNWTEISTGAGIGASVTSPLIALFVQRWLDRNKTKSKSKKRVKKGKK